MSETTIYFAPGTCARVSLIALEETGVKFQLHTIAFMAGEHRKPEFLALNPKGKVPALAIEGALLTENIAILTYLADRFPEAKLLPEARNAIERSIQLADLSFCASTLHPIVTRIRMSPIFAGPENARAVWEKGCQAMDDNFALIDKRLSNNQWWYGDQWSVLDAYLNWVFFRVSGARYNTERYPNFERHAAQMQNRPAVRQALKKERAAEDHLKERGLLFTPPDPTDYT
ncbi:glutathione S-transferase family protein [Emcibacter sp.]|uniref:glutathione S-transferase family protein n=1 Tax=Emcibacter sp. TaxID=1979954 RepID=UPI002AA81338|nr:glutathione S-transferase family protein [Emcibacter sp.]